MQSLVLKDSHRVSPTNSQSNFACDLLILESLQVLHDCQSSAATSLCCWSITDTYTRPFYNSASGTSRTLLVCMWARFKLPLSTMERQFARSWIISSVMDDPLSIWAKSVILKFVCEVCYKDPYSMLSPIHNDASKFAHPSIQRYQALRTSLIWAVFLISFL